MTASPSPDQKIALITGANRGIGFETARQLSEQGFHVIVTARDVEAGKSAAEKIGGEFLELDVADADSIAAVGAAYPHGRLDVLINNAGVFDDDNQTILTISRDHLLRTLQTNTLGPLLVSRAFRGPLAAAAEGGRIINLSSGLGQLHDMESETPSYAISKTALNAITRQLSSALLPKNIAVNSVCPGWVRTEMGGEDADRSVEEGADTVVWLATEAPMEVTGYFLRDRKPIEW